MGRCWLSRCKRLGNLFLYGEQGPSDKADCVHSRPANLPRCDNRLALSRQYLFGSRCKRRNVFLGRSSGGNPATATKSFTLVRLPKQLLGATRSETCPAPAELAMLSSLAAMCAAITALSANDDNAARCWNREVILRLSHLTATFVRSTSAVQRIN
jgi:hypothetical protein